jgi:PAS domain S-box-containing protein
VHRTRGVQRTEAMQTEVGTMTKTKVHTNGNRTAIKAHLLAEIADLRAALESVRQEKADLELVLTTMTEHSDAVEEDLHDRAAAALRESEARLRLIVEATPVPMVISRTDGGEIVYANAMAGPLVGRRVAEFFCNPQDQERLLALLATHGQVDHHEIELAGPTGAPRWVELSLRPLHFNGEPCLLSAWHDISHLKAMNQAASRFVPQEYLSFLDKPAITDINLGDYITGEMTVMFSDLRSFTTISESMTPQENFAFINAYLGRVSPVVRNHGGFIIKYLGDGIHAVFPRSADDAVRAGIEKLEQVEDYNKHRRSKGRMPIHIGIGINTGHMMMGMVGEQHRMQGDAFSDEVNLTARLEGLTKYYAVSMIISTATYARLADAYRYPIRFLDRVQVKGKEKPLDLYEVYAVDPPAIRRRKQETQEIYEEALRLFYAREFQAAQARLFDVLQQNPRDKVAWQHLVKATQLAENGVPDSWTGVTVMTEK